ncbi:hypothetical protein V498_03929 [Pseudogymnoascus sp. VKM F-4517 (FW-2822)]|nr:hypothetical protein V498_03929 [Pseudogymnoascus sp. VKM F-4517 (FW-2822)]
MLRGDAGPRREPQPQHTCSTEMIPLSQETGRLQEISVNTMDHASEEAQIPPRVVSQQNSAPDITPAMASQRRTQQILIVISSLMLTFTGCGLNFAFGVYQELYETMDGPFAGASAAEIDLIGTLAVSLMTIGAPFASAWTKTYSPRSVSLIGGILFAVANITASFGQKLWHFVLTQGLLLGCATCLSYIPAVTVAPGWFNGRRGLAMGIVLSGTGLGGVAWAPLLRYLNATIGFRNALRATGIMAFIMISASALVLKWEPAAEAQRVQEAQGRRQGINIPRANWPIVKSRPFMAHASAAVMQAAAYYTPVYFFSSYAKTLGYSQTAGANFIALSNACNFGGKIVLGWLADRYGRLNALFLTTFVSATATFAFWLPSTMFFSLAVRRALFISFTMLYSVTASAYVALFPTAIAEQFGIQNFASINGLFVTASAYVALFPTAIAEQFGIQNFASINGLLYMLRGIGTLFGTPIAGALIHDGGGLDGATRTFEKTTIMVGVFLVCATVAAGWARAESAVTTGWKLRA